MNKKLERGIVNEQEIGGRDYKGSWDRWQGLEMNIQ